MELRRVSVASGVAGVPSTKQNPWTLCLFVRDEPKTAQWYGQCFEVIGPNLEFVAADIAQLADEMQFGHSMFQN